jgi:Flp pilus assembly protein TadD
LSLRARLAAWFAALLLLGLPCGLVADDRERESREHVAFGIEVAQRGLWREAIYRWEKAVELDPENASARNNLAVAYEQSGEFDLANEAYERALELDSDNLYIRQNYELFREAYERKKRTDRRARRN